MKITNWRQTFAHWIKRPTPIIFIVLFLSTGLTNYTKFSPNNVQENRVVDSFHQEGPHSLGVFKKKKDKMTDLALFLPCYPGRDGFDEAKKYAIRTLEFFWPYDSELNVVVVIDDTTVTETRSESDMVELTRSLFNRSDANIDVAFNPRSDNNIYGPGWYIQQLIMFWGDNFTDSEYVGFFDGDTVFVKGIQEYDLFDDLGRPRAIVRYQTELSMRIPDLIKWFTCSYEALKEPVLIDAMEYFPVIVKRKHLSKIREAMLRAHPEYTYFDEMYINVLKPCYFSQFFIMFDVLWREFRDEYSWHFEPHDPNAPPSDKAIMKQGTREENGITDEMMKPFPRCANHAFDMNHDEIWRKIGGVKKPIDHNKLVSDVIVRGYCFSQPVNEVPGFQPDRRCDGFDLYNDLNAWYDFAFGGLFIGERWTKYAKEDALEITRTRRQMNKPRYWNQDEVSRAFHYVLQGATWPSAWPEENKPTYSKYIPMIP